MSYTAAVITVSDKGSLGQRRDTSGPALCTMLEQAGWDVCHRAIVPDDAEKIREQLLLCSDSRGISLVLTTGGTGFSPRDITPEATQSVLERGTPGIAEAMRAESMKITPRGCLSRGTAGIRGRTLIVNLPGSEKAATENLAAVLGALEHGVQMLASDGSADCAAPVRKASAPSLDAWLREAKADPDAPQCGMYLFHNGVVRATAKAQVREAVSSPAVQALRLEIDREKAEKAAAAARKMPGIFHVRLWLNEGLLQVGDEMMLVLIGGDIRPHVLDALQWLVAELKSSCIRETEQLQGE